MIGQLFGRHGRADGGLSHHFGQRVALELGRDVQRLPPEWFSQAKG